MMISGRRRWLGITVGLGLTAACMFEPCRNRLIQSIATPIVGESIQFDSLAYHRKGNLIEIKHLVMSDSSPFKTVQMVAGRAAAKMDGPMLLEKRFHLAKVRLDDCYLQVNHRVPVVADDTDGGEGQQAHFPKWKSELDGVITKASWDAMQADCDAFPLADSLERDLDSKVRSWLVRSQQILLHAGQLADNVQSTTNPLRNANEIRQHLKMLEDLDAEQAALEKQLLTMDSLVAKKLTEIRDTSAQDLDAFRSRTEQRCKSLSDSFAQAVVQQWSQRLANRHLSFLDAAESLIRLPQTIKHPFTMDVRGSDASTPVVYMPEVTLQGRLMDSGSESVFQAKGVYEQTQGMDFLPHARTNWSIQTHHENMVTDLKLASGITSRKWSLISQSNYIGGAKAPDSQRTEIEVTGDDGLFQLEVDSLDGFTSGHGKINLMALDKFVAMDCPINQELVGSALDAAWEKKNSGDASVEQAMEQAALPNLTNRELAEAETDPSGVPQAEMSKASWVAFAVTVQGGETSLNLQGDIPDAVVAAIAQSLIERIELRRQQTEATYSERLDTRCGDFEVKLTGVVTEGRQTMARHRELLADVRGKLHKRIETDSSFEYARAYLRESLRR